MCTYVLLSLLQQHLGPRTRGVHCLADVGGPLNTVELKCYTGKSVSAVLRMVKQTKATACRRRNCNVCRTCLWLAIDYSILIFGYARSLQALPRRAEEGSQHTAADAWRSDGQPVGPKRAPDEAGGCLFTQQHMKTYPDTPCGTWTTTPP